MTCSCLPPPPNTHTHTHGNIAPRSHLLSRDLGQRISGYNCAECSRLGHHCIIIDIFPVCSNYCKHYGSLVRAYQKSVVIIVNIAVNWSKQCFIISLLMDRGSRVELSPRTIANYLHITKQIKTPCCLENQVSSGSNERSPVACGD